MKSPYSAALFGLALSCLVTGPARAQNLNSDAYTPPPSGSFVYEPGGRRLLFVSEHLKVAAFVAFWDIPVSTAANDPKTFVLENDPGPLLTADYFLSPSFSIGGWWNPTTSELVTQGPTVPGGRLKLADVSTNYWDIHAAYHPPRKLRWARGLSFQVGYNSIHYDVDLPAGTTGITDQGFSFRSPNLWINGSTSIWNPVIRGKKRTVKLYGSAGRHLSSEFRRDWNLLLGGSVEIARHLSLSSSVWLNGIQDDPRVRVTAGLSGSF